MAPVKCNAPPFNAPRSNRVLFELPTAYWYFGHAFEGSQLREQGVDTVQVLRPGMTHGPRLT